MAKGRTNFQNHGLLAPIENRAKEALRVWGATGSGISALTQFVFPDTGFGGYGNNAGWFSFGFDRDQLDWGNVNAQNSSIVMANVNFTVKGAREAVPTVYRLKDDGSKIVLPNHRFIKFLLNPNPYYSFYKMLVPSLISYWIDGNSYWFKERGDNGLGQTRALYYIPHYMIEPRVRPGSGDYVSYYEYNVNGRTYEIPPNRIVHIRNGLDPLNPTKGRKILHPVLSEIYTDEESAAFSAALIKNTGIPGVIITPDTEKTEVRPEDADALKEMFEQKFSGKDRGKPLVMNFKASIEQMGFSPEQLQFKEIRRLPEERVCAQFGIPPVVVGMGAGLDKSTYNNFEQAERHAYQNALVPLWLDWAEELTRQLLPEFTGVAPDMHFEFDYTGVRALNESQDAIVARVTKLYVIDGILRSELRQATGFVVDEQRDNVFLSQARPKAGLPEAAPVDPPKKWLSVASVVKGLLKAADSEDDLDKALELSLEAAVSDAIDRMQKDMDGTFEEMGKAAEKSANDSLDVYSPESESARITAEVVKEVGLFVLIRAAWGNMAKSVEDDTIDAITLRLGIKEAEAWSEDIANQVRGLLVGRSSKYEMELLKQTEAAIKEAIRLAEAGESAKSIARKIKNMVSGQEMYPGLFKEGYEAAIEAGASTESATKAGMAKARNYRAKLIAVTEARIYQNTVAVESFEKAGQRLVWITDGPECGWKDHDDSDKANRTFRTVQAAKSYPIVHPNCQRRIYPGDKRAKKAGVYNDMVL